MLRRRLYYRRFDNLTWYPLVSSSLKHSPALRTNNFSASQEIPLNLSNLKFQFYVKSSSPTGPYPEPHQSSPCPPNPVPWRSILILSSRLRPGLPSGLFPSGFPTKTLYAPLPSRKKFHTCRIWFFLISSLKYLVSTNHKVGRVAQSV